MTMTRLPSRVLWIASLVALGAGCAGGEPTVARSEDRCGDEVGETCECDDGTEGEYVCDADELACACDESDDSDEWATPRSPVRDAGTERDAGRAGDGGTTGGRGNDAGSSRVDAGTSRMDAGSELPEPPDLPGPSPSNPPTSGPTPRIPEPSGPCPELRSGTMTIGGLSGISLQVGAKKSGTGSLLFYWHGTGSTSGEVNLMIPAAVRREILDQGGIIVSPQRSLGTGGDCSGTRTFSKDDFKVADLIVACAVRNHDIDPRRIYTTGCSAGGLQAGCMASLRSSYVAAAVPNSGGIVFPQQIESPSQIPALMTMHGSAADTVIVTFSQTSATLGNQFARAGGYVLNCNHGGGHCAAPSALQTAGWRFMKDHPFGAKPYASGLPSGFPSYCRPLASTR